MFKKKKKNNVTAVLYCVVLCVVDEKSGCEY